MSESQTPEGAKTLDWTAEGRCVVYEGDPLYEAFKPSREAIEAIERHEAANAQALATLRDMMSRHVTNWPSPKRFGTAVSLIDKTLHAALAQPATPEGAMVMVPRYRKTATIEAVQWFKMGDHPAHLFLGTHKQNMADMRLKGRATKNQAPKVFLTEAEKEKIMASPLSSRKLAAEMGRDPATIRRFRRNPVPSVSDDQGSSLRDTQPGSADGSSSNEGAA